MTNPPPSPSASQPEPHAAASEQSGPAAPGLEQGGPLPSAAPHSPRSPWKWILGIGGGCLALVLLAAVLVVGFLVLRGVGSDSEPSASAQPSGTSAQPPTEEASTPASASASSDASASGSAGSDDVVMSTPEDAMESYLTAWKSKNCDAFMAVTTQKARDYLKIPDCDTFREAADAETQNSHRITDVAMDGKQAVVTVDEDYTSDGEHYTGETDYIFVEEADGWKLETSAGD